MTTVGLVGAGYIGKPFLDRLADADCDAVAYDADESQVAAAEERGQSATRGRSSVST